MPQNVAVYDAKDKLFTKYSSEDADSNYKFNIDNAAEIYSKGDFLIIVREINRKDVKLGKIYFRASTEALSESYSEILKI